jgi:hypothetical protein
MCVCLNSNMVEHKVCVCVLIRLKERRKIEKILTVVDIGAKV